jgi:hypothetical protein
MAAPGNAIEGKNGGMAHSRFAGLETELICKHKFG